MLFRSKADSSRIGDEDRWNQDLVGELIKKSNEVVTGFAARMITTSMAAIGVLLSLGKLSGIGKTTPVEVRVIFALACIGYFVAVVIFALVLHPARLAVSRDDFSAASEELCRLANNRNKWNMLGLAINGIATIVAIILLINVWST